MSRTCRFRVKLYSWTAYEIEVSAADEDAALELAEDLYECDVDQFTVVDGGINSDDVELI